jgi:hypothetical protein
MLTVLCGLLDSDGDTSEGVGALINSVLGNTGRKVELAGLEAHGSASAKLVAAAIFAGLIDNDSTDDLAGGTSNESEDWRRSRAGRNESDGSEGRGDDVGLHVDGLVVIVVRKVVGKIVGKECWNCRSVVVKMC